MTPRLRPSGRRVVRFADQCPDRRGRDARRCRVRRERHGGAPGALARALPLTTRARGVPAQSRGREPGGRNRSAAGPKMSSRRCSRHGSAARTCSVSALSRSATAIPGHGPRSARTVPIGSTSMLRPTPVGARVGGAEWSGTWPAAATQTVFSIARARTRVTQCSSLNRPGRPRGGHHDQLGTARRQGPGELGEPDVVAGHKPVRTPRDPRRPAPSRGRPGRTPARPASRTGGSCGRRRPASRARRRRPPCCTRGHRGRARTPPRPVPPRGPGGLGQAVPNGPSSGSAMARRSLPNRACVASGKTARSAPRRAAPASASRTRQVDGGIGLTATGTKRRACPQRTSRAASAGLSWNRNSPADASGPGA